MYNRVATQGSLELHTTTVFKPLPQAQLAGYRAAQWTAFSFSMCGGVPALLIHPSMTDQFFAALAISVACIRGVGVVGGKEEPEKQCDAGPHCDSKATESLQDMASMS